MALHYPATVGALECMRKYVHHHHHHHNHSSAAAAAATAENDSLPTYARQSISSSSSALLNKIFPHLLENHTQSTAASALAPSSPSLVNIFCPAAYDDLYCWPPTPAGQRISRTCAEIFDSMTGLPKHVFEHASSEKHQNAFAYRICYPNGTWNDWTNYTECLHMLTSDHTDYLDLPDDHHRDTIRQLVVLILFFCSLISLVLLCTSLCIFYYFKSLSVHSRIRIHRNLVIALTMHSLLLVILAWPHMVFSHSSHSYRLSTVSNSTLEPLSSISHSNIPISVVLSSANNGSTSFFQHSVSSSSSSSSLSSSSSFSLLNSTSVTVPPELIESDALQVSLSPSHHSHSSYSVDPGSWLPSYRMNDWLCKLILTTKLYSTLASINWMFIEGLQLHSRITTGVFRKDAPFRLYYFIGWGLPSIVVAIWVILMTFHQSTECWTGYGDSVYLWIIVGPMIFALLINCIFLVNIIRVLLTKLRLTITIEMTQIRKAIKATALLFPLLGISHLLFCINPDDDGQLEDAYMIFNAFLQSSQGIFVAVLYCFMDTEVQQVLQNSYERNTRSNADGFTNGGFARNSSTRRRRNYFSGWSRNTSTFRNRSYLNSQTSINYGLSNHHVHHHNHHHHNHNHHPYKHANSALNRQRSSSLTHATCLSPISPISAAITSFGSSSGGGGDRPMLTTTNVDDTNIVLLQNNNNVANLCSTNNPNKIDALNHCAIPTTTTNSPSNNDNAAEQSILLSATQTRCISPPKTLMLNFDLTNDELLTNTSANENDDDNNNNSNNSSSSSSSNGNSGNNHTKRAYAHPPSPHPLGRDRIKRDFQFQPQHNFILVQNDTEKSSSSSPLPPPPPPPAQQQQLSIQNKPRPCIVYNSTSGQLVRFDTTNRRMNTQPSQSCDSSLSASNSNSSFSSNFNLIKKASFKALVSRKSVGTTTTTTNNSNSNGNSNNGHHDMNVSNDINQHHKHNNKHNQKNTKPN